jgi:MFS family permease
MPLTAANADAVPTFVRPSEAPVENGHPRRWLMLPVLLIGAFLLPLDYSIVNVALPSIHESLGADPSEMQLIVAFYAVTYSVFLITGGRLGDLFGRKAMFIGGMAGFLAASAACGFAPTIHVLIAGRLLQGFAAALMLPQVLATIRMIFPAKERSQAIGYYGVMIGLGLVLGQLIGGLLINLHPFGFTWQSIFLVNLPVGALDLAAAAWLLPPSERSGGVRLDIRGVLVLSAALVLLVYPLAVGREAGWPAWTLLCVALSIPAMALFVLLEQQLTRRGGSPLLDIRLFRDRAFSVGLALSLMVYVNAAYFFTYSVYLQSGLGWNVLFAGLATLPFGLGFMAGSLAVPSLVARLGHGAPRLGYVCVILGHSALIATLLRGEEPGVLMFAAMACAGVGIGIVFPSLIQIVLHDVPAEHAGMIAGALNTAIQIGPALAVPVIGSVFFTMLGNTGSASAYTNAFAAALACIVASYVVCLGLTTLLRPQSRD